MSFLLEGVENTVESFDTPKKLQYAHDYAQIETRFLGKLLSSCYNYSSIVIEYVKTSCQGEQSTSDLSEEHPTPSLKEFFRFYYLK